MDVLYICVLELDGKRNPPTRSKEFVTPEFIKHDSSFDVFWLESTLDFGSFTNVFHV